MSLRNQHPDSKEYRKQTDWTFKIRPVLKHKFQRLFLYEPCTSTAPPFLPRGKNTQSHLWFQIENVPAQDINDNDEYISKAPNPSISDPHEAQSAVGVQLKPSKQRNQRHQEEVGDGRVKGQGPSIEYTTNYTLHNSLSHPVSLSFSLFLFPLPPSLHFSSRHSLSLPLRFTDRSARQTTAVHEKKTKQKKSLPGDQGSSEKAEVKRKVLSEVLNCETELMCRMWEGKLFQASGARTENDLWPKPLSFDNNIDNNKNENFYSALTLKKKKKKNSPRRIPKRYKQQRHHHTHSLTRPHVI